MMSDKIGIEPCRSTMKSQPALSLLSHLCLRCQLLTSSLARCSSHSLCVPIPIAQRSFNSGLSLWSLSRALCSLPHVLRAFLPSLGCDSNGSLSCRRCVEASKARTAWFRSVIDQLWTNQSSPFFEEFCSLKSEVENQPFPGSASGDNAQENSWSSFAAKMEDLTGCERSCYMGRKLLRLNYGCLFQGLLPFSLVLRFFFFN